MAHDVFISYSTKDKPIADAACAKLEDRKVRCWIAPRDVLPGMHYGEAIIDAINECTVMILIFSSSANESGQIRLEVERAVSKGITIIPLRIEAVMPTKSLEYFIGSVHWLDALTPPMEKHLEYLSDTVNLLLSRIPGRDGQEVAKQLIDAEATAFIDNTTERKSRCILWVDDQPANNSKEVAILREKGIDVLEVTSTTEAMKIIITSRQRINAIISDMGRREEGEYRSKAGLMLIKAIRRNGIQTPIFVFSASRYLEKNREDVLACGGNGAVTEFHELVPLISK